MAQKNLEELKQKFLALQKCEKCKEKWHTNHCQIPMTFNSGCTMWQSFLATQVEKA